METALRIVDEDGADALSMRSLAQRLDSSTATLYRHFGGRPDLIAQVIDRMFGEAGLSTRELGATSWQQACRTVAQQMFEVLRRHGNVARLLLGQVPMGPNAMALREGMLAMLLENGFEAELAALSYATLGRFVLGFAIETSAPEPEDGAASSAQFGRVDPERFPATAAAAGAGALGVPIEDEFAFGLELLLQGLSARAQDRSSPR